MNESCFCCFFKLLSQFTINDLVDIHIQSYTNSWRPYEKHANKQFVKNDQMNENQKIRTSEGDSGMTHKSKTYDERENTKRKAAAVGKASLTEILLIVFICKINLIFKRCQKEHDQKNENFFEKKT